jgi:tetratricopeptide (TPR) repeat protein
MLERYGSSGYHRPVMWPVIACVWVPDPVVDAGQLVALAEKTAPSSYELGAALYRAGRWEEALPRLQKAAEPTGQDADQAHCAAWLFLAMTQQRLGRTEEARRWLDKAGDWLRGARPREAVPGAPPLDREHQWNWWNLLHLQLRYREAEALINETTIPPD